LIDIKALLKVILIKVYFRSPTKTSCCKNASPFGDNSAAHNFNASIELTTVAHRTRSIKLNLPAVKLELSCNSRNVAWRFKMALISLPTHTRIVKPIQVSGHD
jgi:hypothetical protein